MDPGRPPLLSRFVLDVSASLAWVFGDQPTTTDFVTEILNAGCIAPMPWLFEMANGLVDGLRRERLTRDEYDQWRDEFSHLAGLTIDTSDAPLVFNRTAKLAEQYKLSVYDASYLGLAIRHGITLVTFDNRLRTAAEAAGIEVKP